MLDRTDLNKQILDILNQLDDFLNKLVVYENDKEYTNVDTETTDTDYIINIRDINTARKRSGEVVGFCRLFSLSINKKDIIRIAAAVLCADFNRKLAAYTVDKNKLNVLFKEAFITYNRIDSIIYICIAFYKQIDREKIFFRHNNLRSSHKKMCKTFHLHYITITDYMSTTKTSMPSA